MFTLRWLVDYARESKVDLDTSNTRWTLCTPIFLTGWEVWFGVSTGAYRPKPLARIWRRLVACNRLSMGAWLSDSGFGLLWVLPGFTSGLCPSPTVMTTAKWRPLA